MFKVNIEGTPALSMLALEDIDHSTFYLSSDQKCVIMQDNREGAHVVFNINRPEIQVFDTGETSEIIENYPALAVVFPSETVIVSMYLEIKGLPNE